MILTPLYRLDSRILIGLIEDHQTDYVKDSLLVQIVLESKEIHDRAWSGQKLLKFGFYHAIPKADRVKLMQNISDVFGPALISQIENLLLKPNRESIDSLIWVPERLKNKSFNTYLSKLDEFKSELINIPTSDFDKKFDKLSDLIFNNLCLVAGKSKYRIVEIEFYFNNNNKENSGKSHIDPYIHGDNQQLTNGRWYFNGFGIDITFGQNPKIFGGILIRGIKLLGESTKYISGPSNVFKEILNNIGDAFSNNGFYLSDLDIKEKLEIEIPIKTVRVGLSKNPEDTDNFIEKNYRYIIELNSLHNFNGRSKLVQQLLKNSVISKEKAKEVLGYNLK
jgi:hypothetical protein